ncbi:double-strand break repair protein AddB [Albidovulum sp.]|uniref:double-strand break repair protein AddB n=1 Tax=Albidovulum sp. TaxID=1872424 RepID=UPI0039B939EE
MTERAAGARLFGLPPGADFPAVFVDGLLARMQGTPPEALARVTVYLNTARMLAAVRAAFDARGPRLLPRLRLVTDLAGDPLPAVPAAVPPLRRRLELARLVAELVGRERTFAPGTPVFALADSLAVLLAEMQGEGVAPDAFEAANLAENHAAHWERSLAFIRIIARYFAADAEPDAEARQRRVAEAMAERWARAAPADPVIVAGSTGSRGATQILMRAVASLPNGAVVLPGFDFDMPESAWTSLRSGPIPNEDHPQYRFLALTRSLGAGPEAVQRWVDAPAPDPARNRILSLSLRPAPVTDQWMAEGAALGPLAPATAGLTLIEAPTPRAEALAIALRLRKAAEQGKRAHLVTPDRILARRVTAALDRWGILPDDSAGSPLVQSAPGRLLRHVAQLFGRRVSAEALIVLLKHPLTATGGKDRGPHLRFTRELELSLRRHGPAFPAEDTLLAWAGATGEADRIAWARWIGSSLAGVDEAEERPLSACVETHLALAGILAAGPSGTVAASELWRKEAGQLALSMMEELRREAAHGARFSPADYADLVMSLLSAAGVRQTAAAHPLIAIRGTLEARVGGADVTILAGLNEGVWPAAPAPDPWLSRQMRLKAGLRLPERQIGLSAHDYQQAVGAAEVVLSRAARDDDAETVPSRWLARLTNLVAGLPDQGGPDALKAMQARGREWLDLAASLEHPGAAVPPAVRPSPRPPVGARPRELAVTGVATLIRDPYAIYARHILRLFPLDPLSGRPDARLRGEILHDIVEHFVRDRPPVETLAGAEARLLALSDHLLAVKVPWPGAQRMWRARIARIAGLFVAAEAIRAARGHPVVLEEKGAVLVDESGFTLTARPDRIDLLADGRVHIYDYKSGNPPSPKQQRSFDKQLLLEAAMAERGAFGAIGPCTVEGATYIRLGGGGREARVEISPEILDETWRSLGRLIAAFGRAATGYTSRRAMFGANSAGDYDHLARFGEWEMASPSFPEDVG